MSFLRQKILASGGKDLTKDDRYDRETRRRPRREPEGEQSGRGYTRRKSEEERSGRGYTRRESEEERSRRGYTRRESEEERSGRRYTRRESEEEPSGRGYSRREPEEERWERWYSRRESETDRWERRQSQMKRRAAVTVLLLVVVLLGGGWFYSRLSGGGIPATSAAGEESTGEDSWCLILVNKDHPVPDDYTVPELTQLKNDNSVDSRIYPSLQKMFDDMRSQGLKPYITSSYRTHEYQQKLMDDKVASYEEQGMSRKEAEEEAEKWVAIPGTSEHEIGLAVDISVQPSDDEDQTAEDKQAVWDWLDENSWKYGFIRRYPEDKSSITGISNEQWHFRYVGDKAAKVMHEENLCLEEYLEKYGS